MFKSTLIAALMMFGLSSQAAVNEQSTETISTISIKAVVAAITKTARPMAVLNWNVGSTADYNMAGGFISGTIHSQVREETPQGYWIQQDMDMGFLGAQKVEIHMNKETGEVIELLVNGQKQSLPNAADMEIKESRREKVTVPAGEFDSVWLKIHDKSKNEDSQVWVNPGVVPMGGMIKTIAPSQLGEITIELTAFKI